VIKKERRQSRDMETITEQEYLTCGQTSSDSKCEKSPAADVPVPSDDDDPFLGMHKNSKYLCNQLIILKISYVTEF